LTGLKGRRIISVEYEKRKKSERSELFEEGICMISSYDVRIWRYLRK
jgi:hypothetical protein